MLSIHSTSSPTHCRSWQMPKNLELQRLPGPSRQCHWHHEFNITDLFCVRTNIDGTFATCPKPFKQLIIIHGKYGNRTLPFAFCIDKRTVIYREMLRQLQQSILRLSGQPFQPAMVICDFEISLMTAIETELPNVVIRGCFFHFCQSLWRKVQELGLSVVYRQVRSVKNVVRKIMSLAFLPTAIVRMTFNLIYRSRSVARLFTNYPSLREFVDYFTQNYLNGLFRPPTWNVYERDVDCRTNNHVEGYYFTLLLMNCCIFVNFYVLI